MAHGEVLAVRDLVEGQDFRIADGGVQLDRKLIEPILSEAGAGIATESSVIRLTDTGDAVLTSKGGGVGLMLFIVPLVGTRAQEALFEQICGGEPDATANPDSAGPNS